MWIRLYVDCVLWHVKAWVDLKKSSVRKNFITQEDSQANEGEGERESTITMRTLATVHVG